MWQQQTQYGLQLSQTEPFERGAYDPFRYFARRSREVHRQNDNCPSLPPAIPRHSPLSQYEDDFEDRNLQRTGEKLLDHDQSCASSLDVFWSTSADPVCGRKGERRAGYHLEKLPSPTELMGRRRRKRGGRTQRGDMTQRQTAVTQHIGDLRRKQSFINQMKGEKWWGSAAVCRPERSFFPEEGQLTQAGFAIPSPSLHALHGPPACTNLFSPEPNAGCKEMLDLAPGGNPMMSFVMMGTAYRGAQRDWENPVQTHTAFLGIGCNIEE
ncbi:uncharacterized protein LOC143518786 isoform X2 [Brachyhypopomus gauderio]|uniref:uncharacterized protein LOC143518786 isoform X2 n=1 Tax=Brachyhypopomus gauderio TaxID=698409 RepID=UPI00404109E3